MNPLEAAFRKQAEHIFSAMSPQERQRLYPRRIAHTPGYLHPALVAVSVSMGYFMDGNDLAASSDGKVSAILQQRWTSLGAVQYLLSAPLLKAIANTEIQVPAGALHAPLPAMVFALPEGVLRSPSNGDCLTLSVVRISPEEARRSVHVDTLSGPVELGFQDSRGGGGIWGVHTMTSEGTSFGLLIEDERVQESLKDNVLMDRFVVYNPLNQEDPSAATDSGQQDDKLFIHGLFRAALNLLAALNSRPDLLPTQCILERPERRKKGRIVKEAIWQPRRVGWAYSMGVGKSSRKLTDAEREGRPMTVVRGYTRLQAYGPRDNPAHKLIWVEPYWRVL